MLYNEECLEKLDRVHPLLKAKVREIVEICGKQGIDLVVCQGLRTVEEQDALYALGRDEKGEVVKADEVVTKAKGGHSWHNFGLAVDLAPEEVGSHKIDWHAGSRLWAALEAAGAHAGLVCGCNFRSFPDAPHFQLTGKFPVSPNDEVREIYVKGGIEAVWEASGLEIPKLQPIDAESVAE